MFNYCPAFLPFGRSFSSITRIVASAAAQNARVVAFKAAFGSDSDGPVIAVNGQPPAPGGGAPGEAYLEINRAMHAATSARELARIKKESALARLGASIDPDSPQKTDKETEKAIFELLKFDVVDSPRVEGGFIQNDKATLSITGSLQGKRVSEKQNIAPEEWEMENGCRQDRVLITAFAKEPLKWRPIEKLNRESFHLV